MLGLPSQALVDTGASKGRSRRTRARLQRIESGMDVYASRQPRNRAANDPKYKLASRMHRLLTLGSVTRAAKCLEALALAQPTTDKIEALRALHPSAPPPPAPAITTVAVHVSLDVFGDELRQLPNLKGSGCESKRLDLRTCQGRHTDAGFCNRCSFGVDQRYPCWWFATPIGATRLQLDRA